MADDREVRFNIDIPPRRVRFDRTYLRVSHVPSEHDEALRPAHMMDHWDTLGETAPLYDMRVKPIVIEDDSLFGWLGVVLGATCVQPSEFSWKLEPVPLTPDQLKAELYRRLNQVPSVAARDGLELSTSDPRSCSDETLLSVAYTILSLIGSKSQPTMVLDPRFGHHVSLMYAMMSRLQDVIKIDKMHREAMPLRYDSLPQTLHYIEGMPAEMTREKVDIVGSLKTYLKAMLGLLKLNRVKRRPVALA